MAFLNNPPSSEDLMLWISGTYMVIDLTLTKSEKLLDHALRIHKKVQKFRTKEHSKRNEIPH